jgi:hypothetical protein
MNKKKRVFLSFIPPPSSLRFHPFSSMARRLLQRLPRRLVPVESALFSDQHSAFGDLKFQITKG